MALFFPLDSQGLKAAERFSFQGQGLVAVAGVAALLRVFFGVFEFLFGAFQPVRLGLQLGGGRLAFFDEFTALQGGRAEAHLQGGDLLNERGAAAT